MGLAGGALHKRCDHAFWQVAGDEAAGQLRLAEGNKYRGCPVKERMDCLRHEVELIVADGNPKPT